MLGGGFVILLHGRLTEGVYMTNEARIRANQIAHQLDTINAELKNIDSIDDKPTEVRVATDAQSIVTYDNEDLAAAVKTIIKLALLKDKAALEKEMEAL